MANDQLLFLKLAEALGQPNKNYQALETGLQIPEAAMKGYERGAQFGDTIRKRKLDRQTLSEALGGKPIEEGIMNFTGETGNAQDKNILALASLLKAKKEANQKGLQFVGTKGNAGLQYDPNAGSLSTIPIPGGVEEPIIPRTVSPSLSPYADPGTGVPLQFTPGKGLTPASVSGGTGGAPVLKQGNEAAINDVSIMKSQMPNIDVMFDAYKQKNPVMARLQATPAGSVLDPVAKQAENSLKLAAFTFGGKALTGQEKQVIFGAFFPSLTDNAQSLENKRALLKDYFTGKIDLLQAANLLGPAGAPLKAMLQSKAGPSSTLQIDPEAESAIARVNASNIPENQKKARIAGIRAAAGIQ